MPASVALRHLDAGMERSLAFATSDIVGPRRAPLQRAVVFVVWLVLAAMLCWSEVIWRDEMRALSIALQGDSFTAMFSHLHGDGHPGLWHILLRSAYMVVGSPLVLKAVALAIATAAAYVLVYHLTLPCSILLLALFSNFALYEYAAMARNYGISMLLVFIIAAAYGRWKQNGVVLGLLLAGLVNTNVHSVVLVCGFLTYWFIDLALQRPRPALSAYRFLATAAAISAVGIVLCVMTVYPTFNDAAQVDHGDDGLIMLIFRALAAPGLGFISLYPTIVITPFSAHPMLLALMVMLMSALIYGSIVSLAEHPAAMVAAFLTLAGLSLLFAVVYPGSYRHAALWLVFMIAMTSLSANGRQRSEAAVKAGNITRVAVTIGRLCFLVLLALQVVSGLEKIHQTLLTDIPLSRSRDFSTLVLSRPDLRDAIVIADPDYLVESLPYYIPNKTYLMREERFGNVVKFTRNARLDLGLGDILQTARKLREDQHVPVIILLSQRLDAIAAPVVVPESYNWHLTITAAGLAEFREATELLKRFGPVTGSDETFDAYLLK
jgi:hypothetical protein